MAEREKAFPAFEVIDQWDKGAEKYRETIAPMGGMDLRDYFAAKAMQALIPALYQHPTLFDELVAESAYRYADAMLKAREGQ